jgi:HK97 family phage portal protein
MHKGLDNAAKVAVLEDGVTFTPVTITPDDAQFIEQQRFNTQQIANVFRVPVWKLNQGLEGSGSLTYANVEQAQIDFVTGCLLPYTRRIEGALRRDGDLRIESSLFPEFLLDGLLRADAKTRAEIFSIALDPQKGWMNRNEVRELENLPPDEAESTTDFQPGADE